MEKKNSKKKFDLSTDMINIETTDPTPMLIQDAALNTSIKATKGTQPAAGKTKLTLSVPKDFLPEYKAWCVRHNKNMSDTFVDALKLLKKEYGY